VSTEGWIVDNPVSERYPIYTRGNVGEVFPDPVAPLSWTIAGIPGAEYGWRDALVRLGAFEHDEFSDDQIEVLGVFGGYCYLNVSISRIFGVRTPGLTPEAVDYSLFGEQADVEPYRPDPRDERPDLTERITRTIGWLLTTEEVPEPLGHQQAMRELRAARPDLGSMSHEELWHRTRALMGEWFRPLFAEHIFTTYCSVIGMGIVQTVCGAVGDPSLAMRLVAGVGGVDSAAPSAVMWRLGRLAAGSAGLAAAFDAGVGGLLDRLRSDASPDAERFLEEFDRFLYDFGSRGPNEWEMRCPTWETRPELALTAIDRMRLSPEDAAPEQQQARLAADREQLAAQVSAMLAGDPEAQGQFLAGLRAAALFLAARERTKTNIVIQVHECRMMMQELGRRMAAAGHLDDAGGFGMLTVDEVDAWLADPASRRGTIRERENRHAELSGLIPPFVLNGSAVPTSQWPRADAHQVERAAAGSVLAGIPGCPGAARGRARVILDPFDGGELQPGEVLVAPSTDPSWTPLFVPAAAVVVDVGAQLSHATIVSRELGIPCVVSATDATKKLRTGALVEVDGTSGTVSVLEDA
jgi:rifampicin phosphotransferase